MSEDLRTVAVMFTSVVPPDQAVQATVGALAAEFDEEQAAHLALHRAAAEAARPMAIKPSGHGLMAVYPNVAALLQAATTIRRQVAERSRGAPVAMTARIGVSAGDATLDGGDYYGAAVVEAARLCSVAQPGQVLATELVPLLLDAPDRFHFEPLGPMELKGLPDPVTVVAVLEA
jgi:class 3 adenylate cyclase